MHTRQHRVQDRRMSIKAYGVKSGVLVAMLTIICHMLQQQNILAKYIISNRMRMRMQILQVSFGIESPGSLSGPSPDIVSRRRVKRCKGLWGCQDVDNSLGHRVFIKILCEILVEY
jgi:hypothetical protein